VAHHSLDYRYSIFRVFYDVGADWDQSQDPAAKHSVGFGIRVASFSVLLGFPLASDRAGPAFIAGLNF
jgi:hypothetical protein